MAMRRSAKLSPLSSPRSWGKRCTCALGLFVGFVVAITVCRGGVHAEPTLHLRSASVAEPELPLFGQNEESLLPPFGSPSSACQQHLDRITADGSWKNGHVVHKFFSQFGQDAAVFHSIFAADYVDASGKLLPHDSRYRTRTFIDLAANHWRDLSNTLFFEQCLGWRGICIEPDSGLAKMIEDHRPSCGLVKTCVMDRPTTVQFASAEGSSVQARGMAGVVGVSVPNNHFTRNITMKCTTLNNVITDKRFVRKFIAPPAATERARRSSPGSSVTKKKHHVDFMSLDIEGAESIALRGVHWATTQIDVILAEAKADTTQVGKKDAGPPLIPILADLGYTVAFQVGEDLIFIHDDAPPAYRTRAAAFIARQNDVTPCMNAGTCNRLCNCAKKRP